MEPNNAKPLNSKRLQRYPTLQNQDSFDHLAKKVMAILGPTTLRPIHLGENDFWKKLEKTFGNIEFKGENHPFTGTDYYAKEFGPSLERRFISFRGLTSPDELIHWKQAAAALEADLSMNGKRVYNFDIGYLDVDKLVLASFKRGPYKLYLGDGVYADLLLKYSGGSFEPMPWAFTDFQDGRYGKSLLSIRQNLKSDLRKNRAAQNDIDASPQGEK